MAYYNGKKVLSVVQVKEVEVDYYVGVATLENEKQDEIIVPQSIKVNNTDFPILDGTKTSVVELGGNSVSFNQLQKISTKATYTDSDTGLTITNNNDGSVTISGTILATKAGSIMITNPVDLSTYSGYKYLTRIVNASPYLTFRVAGQNNGNLEANQTEKIWVGSADRENNSTIYMAVVGGVGETIDVTIYPQTSNLTLMGLENTTIEQFKALFPLDYYPYNSGEIKSTILSKIESWGYNLFDEELEIGGLDSTNGRPFANANNLRSVNFTKVAGGNSITLSISNFTDYASVLVYGYDETQTFIGVQFSIISPNASSTHTLPSNCAYIKLRILNSSAYSSVPTDPQICLHIAGSRTGYAPYVGKLGQINIPNAPLILNGVNYIHDTLLFEEQSDGTYNAILTRKLLVLDLGTINWGTPNSNGWVITIGAIDAKPNESSSTMPNAICDKYTIGTPNKAYTTDGYISINTSSNVTARDSSFIGKTGDEIKATMSGVMLYSELATPTTEVIATGLTFDQVATLFEKGGTLEIDNSESDYIQNNSTMAFAVRRFRSEEE